MISRQFLLTKIPASDRC